MARANDEAEVREHLDRIEADPDLRQHPLYEDFRWLAKRYFRLGRQLRKVTRMGDQLQVQLRDTNAALEKASLTDPLTGLPNRRHMMAALAEETARAEREGGSVTVMMVDVDHFKAVNDTHGHDTGDTVLCTVARALATGLREYDVCARWGGEEFLLLLPGVTPDNATDVAERVRQRVADSVVETDAGPVSVTVSIGVATCGAADGPDACVNTADKAAYAAKQRGRNRVVAA